MEVVNSWWVRQGQVISNILIPFEELHGVIVVDGVWDNGETN